ncbi:hypothetical protein FB567DRAFT_577714 [Paraphoma chrysanthemicola]|uniref:Uncharacterized protein n=1 Tax=Paraphoma chrysanthemicola TaxID=798071 RepID=A0A8K0RD50_9PLEO|nr:hypothetical protein FB567DRAFT_577714 [Paraphoma chrysanthemicola]
MPRVNEFFRRFASQPQAITETHGAFDTLDTPTSVSNAPREAITLRPSPDEDPDFIRLEAENEQLRQRIEQLKDESSCSKDLLNQCVISTESELTHLRTEVASLRTNNRTLTNRCEELEQKSQLAQSVLTQHDATTKLELELASKERDKLRLRCDDLTEQSQVNQSIAHDCAAKLRSSDIKIETLQFLNENLRKENTASQPTRAQITNYHTTIQHLQNQLRLSQEHALRLRAWGCADACPAEQESLTLSRRVETLESENRALRNGLAEHKARARREMGALAEECNALTEQLRVAETDARCYLKASRVSDKLFRMLKAEYDHAIDEALLERVANTELEKHVLVLSSTITTTAAAGEVSTHSVTGTASSESPLPTSSSSSSALQAQIHILTIRLAKATASSTEREKLLDKFKEQQKQLMHSVKQDRLERKELQDKIEALYRENRRDRERFEERLRRRDGIGELEGVGSGGGGGEG